MLLSSSTLYVWLGVMVADKEIGIFRQSVSTATRRKKFL